mmetsp:Transcript_16029/g.36076  ORF Transcript_16029/g.36076 Transcript_16029/m.36076 type:complete len:106 (-) Transcript_16029:385-702(-)
MITIDDLTRGLLQYKSLGLDFERVEAGRLRLKFTQIDRAAPSRKFSCTIHVNENNEYEIYDVSPPVDGAAFAVLRNELMQDNSDNRESFRRFIIGMRKEFVNSCS